MKVVVPKFSGFCPGVVRAERGLFALAEKEKQKKIYVVGKLIHNAKYITYIEEKGIKTIANENELPNDCVAVIRTHGIDRRIEKNIRDKVEVVDLTCGKVKQVQQKIAEYSERGFRIVIAGKADHPEVQGLRSYADDVVVIENNDQLEKFLFTFKENKKNILVVSQTTGSRKLFEYVSALTRELFSHENIVDVYDSICSVTSIREEEALVLQKNTDITFVIGDHESANANKVFDILKDKGQPAYFIEDLNDLLSKGIDCAMYTSALVVSSSSTPSFIEQEVIAFLSEK